MMTGFRFPFGKAKAQAPARPSEKEPGDVFERALDFEAARIGTALESEAKAWRCAKGLGVLLALEAAAIALMMPLKTSVPYVIEVDRKTGSAAILEIADAKKIPVSEASDKHWAAEYVLARESYDYRTLENDFIKTREMSLPAVFEPYAAQFGEKEGSLEKVYGDARQVRVTLVSVVPNGNGIATVRFRKELRSTQTGAVIAESLWTATLGYEYRPEFRAPESSRLVNPFGFRVTSYRADPEIAGKEGEK